MSFDFFKKVTNPDKFLDIIKDAKWGADDTENAKLKLEREKAYTFIKANSKLILEICNQIILLFGRGSNWMALYPRLDFYGLGFIPQLFLISATNEYMEISTGQDGSSYPVINPVTRNLQNASYNIYGKPYTITLNEGILTSFYEKIIFDESLKRIPALNAILRETKSLVRKQLEERVKAGVPFSFFSPLTGYIPYTKIPRLVSRPTEYEGTYNVSISIEEIEVGYLEDFEFE
ncbi:hypothetical protein DB313_05785 (plasmid) [Borrelia turcica IST7]|uniref:Uncharacterized protein n=1 Tax=Borrelia turcica IST7 TaxID=1104446 RepID=A0A386PR38_9SPIR|nr:DUF792 family protein [Borrelia turcica]AYE37010.1 hypothetical protein DB313_05785 [Borrelia turcica IST7]